MDQATSYAAGMAIASLAAAGVKWLSKRESKILHKWAAPLLGVVAAGAADAVFRQEIDLAGVLEGTGAGSTAILMHQLLWKGWLRPKLVKPSGANDGRLTP